MSQSITRKKKIARAYAASLAPKVHVEQALLFGSTVRGTRRTDSDLDLIVLSRHFARLPFLQRLQLLNRERQGLALTVPMDILGFTPKEFATFQRHESPNVRRIYREAQSVYP